MAVSGTVEDLLEKTLAGNVQLVLLDLSLPGLDTKTVVDQLRQGAVETPTIVAYAPHVHATKLAAAREAGCDEVLTRGQFHAQIEQLLSRYLGLLRG